MKISKMCNTCHTHVKRSTLDLLKSDDIKKFGCFDVHVKTDYVNKDNAEYFIYINSEFFQQYICWYHDMPDDLATVVSFAIEIGCDVLHLSQNGEETLCLPRYYYRNKENDNGDMKTFEMCYTCTGLASETEMDYLLEDTYR